MAEFALLAAGPALAGVKAGVDEIVNLVKTPAIDTLVGNRNLETKFPDAVTLPTNVSGTIGAYDFKWRWVHTYRFRSAYYTHCRLTAKDNKKHKEKATKKEVKKGHGNTDEGRNSYRAFKEQASVEARRALAAKYTDKYRKVRDVLKKEPLSFSTLWADFNASYCRKYGATIDPLEADTDPSIAGWALADQIWDNQSRYSEKVHAALDNEWKKRQRRLIRAKNPNKSDAEIDAKVAQSVAAMVASSRNRSVVVAYEVVYGVFAIDEIDVQRRWRTLEKQLEDQKKASVKDSMQRLTEANALLRGGGMQATGLMSDDVAEAENITAVRDYMEEARSDMRKARGLYNSRISELNVEKARVAEWVKNWRAIGAFGIYPVGQCGDLQTGIRWRNTNARISARVAFGADLSVHVNFDWWEESKLSLPEIGPELLSNQYTTNGGMVFKNDGTYEVDGKIGQRFAELCQPLT